MGEDFALLYSNKASSPNTPANVIVGCMILKELLGLTGDEFVSRKSVARTESQRKRKTEEFRLLFMFKV